MYAEINQWVFVELQPEDLGPDFDEAYKRHVRNEYEGRLIDGNYYIAVDEKSVRLLDRPVVQDGTCMTICRVRFSSVVFRPFREECLYVDINKIHKVGLMADFGPMKIFVSAASMQGWKHMEPDDMKPERFVDDIDGFELMEGTKCCVKLQGVRAEPDGDYKFHAVATIADPDLGPVKPKGSYIEAKQGGMADADEDMFKDIGMVEADEFNAAMDADDRAQEHVDEFEAAGAGSAPQVGLSPGQVARSTGAGLYGTAGSLYGSGAFTGSMGGTDQQLQQAGALAAQDQYYGGAPAQPAGSRRQTPGDDPEEDLFGG